MKYRFIFIFCVVLLLSASALAQNVTVISKTALIREKPTSKAKVISTVKKNDRLAVNLSTQTKGWYLVKVGNRQGWIYGNDFKVNEIDYDKLAKRYGIEPSKAEKKEDEWELYAKAADNFLYYRTIGVKEIAKDILQIWGRQKKINSLADKSQTLFLYQVDCRINQVKASHLVIYNKEGSISLDEPMSDSFTVVKPNTYGETFLLKVCGKYWKP